MVRNWYSTRYTSSLKNTQLTLTVLLKGFSRHQEVIQCRVPCNRQTHVWIQLYWSMLSGLLLVTNRLLSTSHCAMLCLATSLVAASMWSGVKCTILEDVWAHSTGGSRGEIAFWKLLACFGDLHSHQHLQSSASSASCNLSRPWCMRAASGNVLLPVDTTVWKDEGHPWCKPSSDLADPAGRSNHNWLLVSNIPRLPQRFCNNNLQQTTGLPMFFDGKNVSW